MALLFNSFPSSSFSHFHSIPFSSSSVSMSADSDSALPIPMESITTATSPSTTPIINNSSLSQPANPTAAIAVTSTSTPTLSLSLPSQSIYVNNLNDKIRLEELKRSLYLVFSAFGSIVEIRVSKSYKLRGQAWISFETQSAATKAVKEMQGFMFYHKSIRVQYSKSESDVVAKIKNTFQPRPKRKINENSPLEGTVEAKKHAERKEFRANQPPAAVAIPQQQIIEPPPMPVFIVPAAPNRILFVENLPSESTELMLNMLFQQYSGYKESRLVPSKPGIAFVEFQEIHQANAALIGLQDFKVTQQHRMKISFAKK